MKRLGLAVMVLAAAAEAQPVVGQVVPPPATRLNEVACRLDGGAGCSPSTGGGSGTGFTYDEGDLQWLFEPPSGDNRTTIRTDSMNFNDAADQTLMQINPAASASGSGVTTYFAGRLAAAAIEQRAVNTLSATGTIVGANVLCSTGAGAVVGTLNASTANVGQFVYITRSGANTCTVGVESGHTLDGVTDGTTTVASAGWKTFVQTGDTAWVTANAYPLSGAVTGLSSVTVTDDNITTTSTDALVLQNTTAATAGVTAQYSPRLRFVGSGWKTTATAAAQQTEWYVEQVPFSRATAPANSLGFVPVRNGVVSSTPLWMCQMAETGAGTFGSGLIFAGTYGRCDNSIGYVGLASAGSNTLGVWNNATLTTTFATTGVGVGSGGTLFFTSSAMALNTSTGDLTLSRGAAATLQLGAAAAASPVAQTLQAQGSRSGTDSNVGGGNLTIQPGAGTGTGTPSSLILNAPVGAASGTGAHTQTAALTIKGAANGALPEVILNGTSSPASGAACTAGAITWDASYIYVCTASGAWKRAALTGGY